VIHLYSIYSTWVVRKLNKLNVMKMLNVTALFIFVVVEIFLSGCAPKQSEDCGFVQNVYGQRISWKSNMPIKLVINQSVPTELRPAIYRAAATWEKNIGRKVFEISEEINGSAKPARDRKNGIYFLTEWESDRKSEQGRTSVYWAGDEIQEADIRINWADFNYYDQDAKQIVKSLDTNGMVSAMSDSAGYNFEALVLHEMGHFLGLKHRENGGTVMATYLSAYTDRVTLADVDRESVQCEYK